MNERFKQEFNRLDLERKREGKTCEMKDGMEFIEKEFQRCEEDTERRISL